MNFKKLLISLFVVMFALNIGNAKAYAAEESTDNEQDKEITADYSEKDLRLLSALIYCEAQSEIYRGKIAVGIVVMNRVRSDKYPDSVKEVIYQKSQFSPASSGSLEEALEQYDKGNFTSKDERECIKAAKLALSGQTSITIKEEEVDFSKFLSFSRRVSGYKLQLGNHQFK
ncbi:MAG: cell wall hydrolase [Mobilitalea sp.]